MQATDGRTDGRTDERTDTDMYSQHTHTLTYLRDRGVRQVHPVELADKELPLRGDPPVGLLDPRRLVGAARRLRGGQRQGLPAAAEVRGAVPQVAHDDPATAVWGVCVC